MQLFLDPNPSAVLLCLMSSPLFGGTLLSVLESSVLLFDCESQGFLVHFL